MAKSKPSRPAGGNQPGNPSIDNPGAAGDLAAEVTSPNAARSPRERAREMEESEILAIFRKEIGGAGFITFQRRHPTSGQTQFSHLSGSMPVDGFSIANVATMYGGGDFIAKARTSEGKFAQEVRFSIDHTLAPKNPMAPAPEKREVAPAAPALDVPALIREIRESTPKRDDTALIEAMKQSAEITRAALARPEPKADNRVLEMLVERMEKSDQRFEALLEKLGERPAEKSLREQLEDAKEIFEMIGGGRGGGGDGDPFWKDIGRGIAEAAGPILKQHFAGAAPNPNGAPLLAAGAESGAAAPALTPTNAMPGATTGEDPNMNLTMQIALNRFRSAALAAAGKLRDPFEFVDAMWDFVPESAAAPIFNTANAADWFARIFGNDAAAIAQIKYLTDVRNAVLAKSFVAHVARNANQPVKAVVAEFLGWVTPDFEDPLFNLTEPENWQELFRAPASFDPAWLESLRKELDSTLDGGPDPIDFAPAATAAAAVTPAPGAASGAAAAVKPAAVKKTPAAK